MENQLEIHESDSSISMADHESYEKSFRTIKKGEYLTGKIVKMQDDGVYVDIGYKQEGFVPLNQLTHRNVSHPRQVVKEGEEIPVVVLKSNDLEGELILSKKRADLEGAWLKVTEAFEKEEIVTATVVEAVKGGLLVDLGLRGFVPASHVNVRPVKDLSEFVGESLRLKVIELDRARRKVVLSRKKVMEEERLLLKDKTLDSIYEGQIIQGTVARLTNFGAFVNLGGVDGLVHISEISWKRIKHPSEVLRNGQVIDVMVLKVDKQKERISLSHRQAMPDPWSIIDETMNVGSMVKGTVTKIAKNYVFVEVADGVEGVVPVNELNDKKQANPEEAVKEGQEIEVRVVEIKKEARRMLLSIREAQSTASRQEISSFTAPAEDTHTGATIGDILKAKMKEEASVAEPKVAPAIQAAAPPKVAVTAKKDDTLLVVEEEPSEEESLFLMGDEEPGEEEVVTSEKKGDFDEEEIMGIPDEGEDQEIILKQVKPAAGVVSMPANINPVSSREIGEKLELKREVSPETAAIPSEAPVKPAAPVESKEAEEEDGRRRIPMVNLSAFMDVPKE